jgi:hypothetical protein
MLVEMAARGEAVDAIVFADTGGERPETYAYVAMFSTWLEQNGMPPIITVQNDGMYKTLENECLTNKGLPSVVFGFKSCSDKYKRRPFTKWLKAQGWTDVVVCIGFDADEPHRAQRGADKADPYTKRYPLLEWDMGRDECVEAIAGAGLAQPGKSSCFFCPNSKSHEILSLPQDLLDRALAMEGNAELTVMKGLGRDWKWSELVRADRSQMKLFATSANIPCGCYDGE